MTSNEEYILNQIHTAIWSGFRDMEDIQHIIEDLGDEDTDEQTLHNLARNEFRKKVAAELAWPVTTDCDRLDDAFVELNEIGIIALHNTGMTMSDGEEDVAQTLHERDRKRIIGYCFYHGQDLERAVHNMGLWLAFGDLDANPDRKRLVGKRIAATLQKHGLTVEWNGDPERRLHIPKLDWKRRHGR